MIPVLLMGAAVYALRLAGLGAQRLPLPPAVEQALRYVPIAVLTALTVSSLASGPASLLPWRGLAALVAAVVVWRTGRLWACILSGLGVYESLRLLAA